MECSSNAARIMLACSSNAEDWQLKESRRHSRVN